MTFAAKGRERTVPLTKGCVEECTGSNRNPIWDSLRVTGLLPPTLIHLEVHDEPLVSFAVSSR